METPHANVTTVAAKNFSAFEARVDTLAASHRKPWSSRDGTQCSVAVSGRRPSRMPLIRRQVSSSVTTSCTLSSTRLHKQKHVRFDPIVVVIEFEYHDHGQRWYTDKELQKFRAHTIERGQKYWFKHSHPINHYQDALSHSKTYVPRHHGPFSGMPAFRNRERALYEEDMASQQREKQALCQLIASLAFETCEAGASS
jgi:hypothetical protein